MSRIGKKIIKLPTGVSAVVSGQDIEITGAKGVRSFTLNNDINLHMQDGNIALTLRRDSKKAQQHWGMSRTQIANLIIGVSIGFKKQLEINGIGYRALMQSNVLKLTLGLSHDVNYTVPDDVQITVPKSTQIIVEGIDQQRVGQVAANIRNFRKPEPYKGKGIKYKNEYIFRKEGKTK